MDEDRLKRIAQRLGLTVRPPTALARERVEARLALRYDALPDGRVFEQRCSRFRGRQCFPRVALECFTHPTIYPLEKADGWCPYLLGMELTP